MPGLACSNAASASSVSFSRESLPQVLIRRVTCPLGSAIATICQRRAAGGHQHQADEDDQRSNQSADRHGELLWSIHPT